MCLPRSACEAFSAESSIPGADFARQRERPAGWPHRHAADGLHGSLMRISGGYVLVRFVGTAESGSSGQGCLGYLPRISARTAA